MYLVETPDDVQRLQVLDPDNIAFVTQTTLSMDDTAKVIDTLRQRFPKIIGPKKDDICYATQNRQDAVKLLTSQCDVVLVVGSRNSSNSNRLREIAEKNAVPAYLIDDCKEIRPEWLNGKERIGITAGASVPEVLVDEVIKHLKSLGAQSVEHIQGQPEHVVFSLPRELQAAIAR